MMFHSFILPIFFTIHVFATLTNRTIDDTLGDIVTGARPNYFPVSPGVWTGSDCVGCVIIPEKARAFRETWTAATYKPSLGPISIDLQFTGVAIYVFFILANEVPNATTVTQCNFTLDGQAAGTFDHEPTNSTNFQYNTLVFSQQNLANVDHKLSIQTAGFDHNVFVSFDYAIYTFDDGSFSTSSFASAVVASRKRNAPIGAIVGGVVGGVGLIALLACFFFYRRRKRHLTSQNRLNSDADLSNPPPMIALSMTNNSDLNITPDESSHRFLATPFASISHTPSLPYGHPQTSDNTINHSHSKNNSTSTSATATTSRAALAQVSSPIDPPSQPSPRTSQSHNHTTSNETYGSLTRNLRRLPSTPVTTVSRLPSGEIVMSVGSPRPLPKPPASPSTAWSSGDHREGRRRSLVKRGRLSGQSAVSSRAPHSGGEGDAESANEDGNVPKIPGTMTLEEELDLKEQIRVMKIQLELLTLCGGDQWAPPPGYDCSRLE